MPTRTLTAGRGDAYAHAVTQDAINDGGATAALAMTMSFHGYPTTVAELMRDLPASEHGVNALDMVRVAKSRGLGVEGVQLDAPATGAWMLERGDLLHVDGSRFVVVDHVDDGDIHVFDPASGPRVIRADADPAAFAGIVLMFSKGPAEMEARKRRLERGPRR